MVSKHIPLRQTTWNMWSSSYILTHFSEINLHVVKFPFYMSCWCVLTEIKPSPQQDLDSYCCTKTSCTPSFFSVLQPHYTAIDLPALCQWRWHGLEDSISIRLVEYDLVEYSFLPISNIFRYLYSINYAMRPILWTTKLYLCECHQFLVSFTFPWMTLLVWSLDSLWEKLTWLLLWTSLCRHVFFIINQPLILTEPLNKKQGWNQMTNSWRLLQVKQTTWTRLVYQYNETSKGRSKKSGRV